MDGVEVYVKRPLGLVVHFSFDTVPEIHPNSPCDWLVYLDFTKRWHPTFLRNLWKCGSYMDQRRVPTSANLEALNLPGFRSPLEVVPTKCAQQNVKPSFVHGLLIYFCQPCIVIGLVDHFKTWTWAWCLLWGKKWTGCPSSCHFDVVLVCLSFTDARRDSQ